MKKRALFAACLLVLAGSAYAIDIQNFQPALGTENAVTLYTSGPLAHGQFGVAVVSSYAADPLTFTFPNEEELKVVERLVGTEFQTSVGLFDFMDLAVSGSVVTAGGKDMDQQLNPDFPETKMEMDTGAGDMRAALKFQILPNKSGSIGIALVPTASFPTGNPDIYAGAEAVNAGGRLVIDKRFDRVNMVVNGGYIGMGDPDEADKGFDPVGRAEFGAGVVIRAHEYVDLLAEIYGRTVDYGIEELDPETPVEAIGAIKLYAGPVHFLAGGGAGVNSGIGSPKARGFGGVAFTWPKLDRKVERPRAVYVQSGPALDSRTEDADKDGLVNYDETHVYHTDAVNPDTDNDGLKDGEEIQKTKTDPKKDDTDGDGLIDFEEVKAYYTDPLKADTDGDTLGDGAEVKQYRTSPTQPDTDEDGVPDNKDAAPLEAETKNGILDEDGIPEVILAKKPSGVTLTDSVIWLPSKLVFTGPGQDKLDEGSRALLRDVSALMAEYPKLKIEVQGHTAPTGNETADRQLSTLQARAVAEAVIVGKVASDRVTFKGYGNQFPVASNANPEGRARNARIDLVITEQ